MKKFTLRLLILVMACSMFLIITGCKEEPQVPEVPKVTQKPAEEFPDPPQFHRSKLDKKAVEIFTLSVKEEAFQLNKLDMTASLDDKTFDKEKIGFNAFLLEGLLGLEVMSEIYEGDSLRAFIEYGTYFYALYEKDNELRIKNNDMEMTFEEFCDKAYNYVVNVDPKPTGGFGLA